MPLYLTLLSFSVISIITILQLPAFLPRLREGGRRLMRTADSESDYSRVSDEILSRRTCRTPDPVSDNNLRFFPSSFYKAATSTGLLSKRVRRILSCSAAAVGERELSAPATLRQGGVRKINGWSRRGIMNLRSEVLSQR